MLSFFGGLLLATGVGMMAAVWASARLPGQTIRHPLQVAAGDQLLDQQPRHDGLARAGVFGEQEAQRLARQHRVVDAGDLVRQAVI